jgi:photosystem II stability/assembly factor-like uncharacterized protein
LKRARFHILLLVLFLTLSSEGFAQWRKITDFGQLIASIDFPTIKDTPQVGFVGVETYSPSEVRLYRTFDGGKTFTSINYPQDVGGGYTIPHRFSFKDSLQGWFSGVDGRSIFETLDGGVTWKIIYSGPISGLYYVPTTNLLICSHISKSYTSTSDGVVFNTVDRLDVSSTRSITFSDGMHGIISATDDINSILITSDGGINWTPVNFHSEFYHPVGVEGTQRFYVMSEACRTNKNNILFRSNDGGLNWNQLFSYKQSDLYLTTGTVQYGINENIFFQTTEEGGDGIMMSIDSGVSFFSICGPSTRGDTKFFVRDTFIYAGDKYGSLWLNTTGIGSNSTPILSKSSIALQAQNCSDIFDTVTFTLFDSCNGRQATLLDVSLNGSTKFSLNSGLVPRSIHPNDTLAIQYKPTSDLAEDTAIIHLGFKLGWKEFDTSITLIGKGYKAKDFITSTFAPDTVYSNTINCSNDSQVIRFRVQDTCRNLFATATKGNISGSSAFVLPPQLPKQSTGDDSLVVTFTPLRFGLDTSMLHVTFELDGVNVDTTFVLIGEFRPSKISLAPSVSDTSLSVTSSNCIGASGHIYYSIFDSCLGVKGELVSATVTGSTNFQVTADADSATVIYNGAGYDTAKLALKFRIYEYEYDTVITLYGYPSATKDSLSFLATLTKPSVTWQETTELRIRPDKAVVNKNLSEIRFDVTLDADVLEPLTNYSTGIAGATIMMSNPTPIGKLMRFPFTITGNNMTLDPSVVILNLPMRPYVSDTTMTTIEVSTINLNPQDPDYERCTLSATGNGAAFTLDLMCGDSLLSQHLGRKPILSIKVLKPNPAKGDVTVTFDLARSGAVKAEVLDVLGNVIKEETLEAPQGESKYNISLPDAAEGVYYVRLKFAGETRTMKFVKE